LQSHELNSFVAFVLIFCFIVHFQNSMLGIALNVHRRRWTHVKNTI